MEVLASRYEVLETIRSEPERSLLRARDLQFDRVMALKVVSFAGEAERDEVHEEARILLSLEPHPGLPTMREGLTLDDRYIIVMDWIEGQNLGDLLEERGAPGLVLSAVTGYVRQAASALDHLHRHDPPIVHGDVKPSNLVLTPAGKIVLVDFGIARPAGSQGEAGTRGYIAPEVSAGEALTPGVDVYGLAATTFALLTGSPPGPMNRELREVDAAVAGPLLRALMHALANDPRRRPASAGELAERIEIAQRALPTGVVTFLVLELVGADALWERDDEDTATLSDRLDELVSMSVEEQGGRLLRSEADPGRVLAVFTGASAATTAALALHRRLAAAHWPTEIAIAARASLHTGEAELRDGAYVGAALVRAGRLRAAAAPGCTLVSASTAELVKGRIHGADLIPVVFTNGETAYELTSESFAPSQHGAPLPAPPPTPSPASPAPPAPIPPTPDAQSAGDQGEIEALRHELAKIDTLVDHMLRYSAREAQQGNAAKAAEFEASAHRLALQRVDLKGRIEALGGTVD
jgi:serine/threonine protein kinase